MIYNAFKSDTGVPFTLSQAGGNVGDVEWSGNIVISEFTMDGEPTSPQTLSFSYEGKGVATRGIVV